MNLQDALHWIVRATDIELADPENEEKLNIVIEAARRVANPDMMAAGNAVIDAGVADLPGIGAVGHVLARIAVNTALGITEDTPK